uniref:Cell shape-determining protein MreC n=1 Tax=Candidatus Kentrum sp. MB TaxID=2138164 RepID=A0A450XVS6_9GAMM|nr:MAG: rod shape-determining protein MreC [Candidatus Kentron sp. MB]VFK76126.1 MAG: rod shape-determining protein MreC [Candidatus Kentron sp. MB]
MVAFILLSLALMITDYRSGYLDSTRAVLSTLISPLHYAIDTPIRIVYWAHDHLATYTALMKENVRLRHQLLLNQVRLGKFSDLEAENARLRQLLGSAEKIGEKVMITEIMAVDMNPLRRQIMIDKGTQDGVIVGHSLVDIKGVMGQVIQTAPLLSTVLLITDPSHALPVQVNRNGFRSIALGTGQDLLELSYIPTNADLDVGDVLVTSGLGGKFPPGYPVGEITQLERDTGQPFARIMVKPYAWLERNREALLVTPTARPLMANPSEPVSPKPKNTLPDSQE